MSFDLIREQPLRFFDGLISLPDDAMSPRMKADGGFTYACVGTRHGKCQT